MPTRTDGADHVATMHRLADGYRGQHGLEAGTVFTRVIDRRNWSTCHRSGERQHAVVRREHN
jgi:hypothetical protein